MCDQRGLSNFFFRVGCCEQSIRGLSFFFFWPWRIPSNVGECFLFLLPLLGTFGGEKNIRMERSDGRF